MFKMKHFEDNVQLKWMFLRASPSFIQASVDPLYIILTKHLIFPSSAYAK